MNLRYEHRQNFNVYTKKCDTEKHATVGLPWTLQGEKGSGKPSNSLAMQEKGYDRATSSKHDLSS